MYRGKAIDGLYPLEQIEAYLPTLSVVYVSFVPRKTSKN